MTALRIIPCLDVDAGRVVKGTRFENLRDCGDPAELASGYEAAGADELVLLDISAGPEGRQTDLAMVRRVRAGLGIPLCVGGGVRCLRDVEALLLAGADKVAINSSAVRRPAFIEELASEFGSQCCVLAVDAGLDRSANASGVYRVLVDSGKTATGLDLGEWLGQGLSRGAGEFLLTSHDRDGTGDGYDLALLRLARQAIGSAPLIASGGAQSCAHLLAAVRNGASAVLLAGALHRGELSIAKIKDYLLQHGEVVRQC